MLSPLYKVIFPVVSEMLRNTFGKFLLSDLWRKKERKKERKKHNFDCSTEQLYRKCIGRIDVFDTVSL